MHLEKALQLEPKLSILEKQDRCIIFSSSLTLLVALKGESTDVVGDCHS